MLALVSVMDEGRQRNGQSEVFPTALIMPVMRLIASNGLDPISASDTKISRARKRRAPHYSPILVFRCPLAQIVLRPELVPRQI